MATEKRLIDANAADVERIPCYYGDHCYTDDVQEWMNEQPTVDAVEVVHGRWVVENETSIRCSECCFNRASIKMPLDYCPNCGAKMDGDGNV